MTDISRCSGAMCPLKDQCYRTFDFKYHPRQSWMEPPYKDGNCEYFIEFKMKSQKVNK